MRILATLTLSAALIGATALADTITLKDGSKREGKIVREDKKQVVLEVAMGRLKAELILARKDIKSIAKGKSDNEKLLAESKRRKARLKKNDASGWLAYARWLDKQSGLSKDATAAFKKVIKLQPDNEIARRRLGYHRVGKKWLTLAEAKAEYKKLAKPNAKIAAGKRKPLPKLDVRISSSAEERRKRAERKAEVLRQLAAVVAEHLAKQKPTASSVVMTPRRSGYYEYAPVTTGTTYGHFDHGYYTTGYYYPYWYPSYYNTARYSYPYTVVTGRNDLGVTAQIRFVKKGSKVVWRVAK
jgi:hypothetical protein